MDRTPKPGQLYRHFKNKIYQIVAIATHSETKEPLVIYQALYDDFGVYARPLDMFVSEVDHVKYPDVEQKYRFELIDKNQGTNSNTVSEEVPAEEYKKEMVKETVTEIEDENVEGVNPLLMEFLDADTYQQKYNLIVSKKDQMTDKLIDDLAVVVDVVIPEGDLLMRYDALKYAIQTKQRYEFTDRLR